MEDVPPPGTCVIRELTGQLVFPAFVAPVHFVGIELQSHDSASSDMETFTGPYEQFRFSSVRGGSYTLHITMAGMDVINQFIQLNPDSCSPSPGAHLVIPIHGSPALKPSPIAEDTVSIETLMAKVPSRTVNAFEKTFDKEAKADPQQISSSLQDILKTAPDYYDANLELGLEYQKEDQRENSTRMLTHALDVNSGSMLARAALGQYRFETGDFQEAADLLSEAVRLGNTSPDVYFMLGTSYYKLGQLDLAEASLRRALDIDEGIGKAHLQLYNVYMKSQLPKKALAEAETYLKEYPDAQDRDYVQSMVDKAAPAVTPTPESSRPKPAACQDSSGNCAANVEGKSVFPMLAALTQAPHQNASPDLQAVVRRATEYVTRYEADLGNLIGTEDYVQTSTWPHELASADRRSALGSISTPNAGTSQRTAPPFDPLTGLTGRTMQRRTAADFLIIKVGPEWGALREVHVVDGKHVDMDPTTFETAFDDSPASNFKRFNSMKAESTRYNIGDVLRESNLPTFALQVLRREEAGRFSFQMDGVEKIDGIQTWKVHFTENTGPTLVTTRKGEELFSNGILWIDPNDGRVLRTEFKVDNNLSKPRVESQMTVSYAPGKGVGILVPSVMLERYQTEADPRIGWENVIECRAQYSNFRRFQTDVKFEFEVEPKPASKQKPF